MSDLEPDKEKAFEQKRLAKRQRVLKSAKIVLDDWRAIDCVLRDVSETGAKIRIGSTTDIKQNFRLYTAMDNMIRDVKLAWKHHDEIGVIFTSEAKSCALRKF